MVYKTFQDLKLSALGMGCMWLPVLNGDDAKVDEKAAAEMVGYAMAHGVNYYDTASTLYKLHHDREMCNSSAKAF